MSCRFQDIAIQNLNYFPVTVLQSCFFASIVTQRWLLDLMTATSFRNFPVAILSNVYDCHYTVTKRLNRICLDKISCAEKAANLQLLLFSWKRNFDEANLKTYQKFFERKPNKKAPT